MNGGCPTASRTTRTRGCTVAPSVHVARRRLLGAHVRRRADRDARARDRLRVRRRDRLGDTEIGDDGVAALDQDVLRLDVPVYDAVIVGVRRASAISRANRSASVDRKLPLALDALPRSVSPSTSGIT